MEGSAAFGGIFEGSAMGTHKSLGLVVTAGLLLAGAGCASQSKSDQTAQAPDAVKEAVMAAHPGASITKVKAEKEEIDEYEVEFTDHGRKMSADVAPNGTIIETEERVEESEVPAAAREAIQRAAEGGRIKGYEKATITGKADKEKNTATKLDEPIVHYEADATKDGKSAEIAVTADGKLAEAPEWKSKESK